MTDGYSLIFENTRKIGNLTCEVRISKSDIKSNSPYYYSVKCPEINMNCTAYGGSKQECDSWVAKFVAHVVKYDRDSRSQGAK